MDRAPPLAGRLVGDDPEPGGVLLDPVDQPIEQGADLAERGLRARGAQVARAQSSAATSSFRWPDARVHQRQGQLALVGVAPIQRALADAGRLGDLGHSHRFDAAGGKQAQRRLEHLLTVLGRVAPFVARRTGRGGGGRDGVELLGHARTVPAQSLTESP